MFARMRAVVLLGLVYNAACGPAFEGNPFLQVLAPSKPPQQKANQTDLYVILPFRGQQLQQSPPAVEPSTAPSPAPVPNHVHSFDCSNRTSSVHVPQSSNSNVIGAAQTVVKTNTPELNRRCLKSTGLFLGTSCDKFVSCLNGTATELSCPEGLMFNAEGLYCDRAENVQCDGQKSAGSTQYKDAPSKHPSIGSPIHASIVQFTAVPPQQVAQTGQQLLQHQQLQQQQLLNHQHVSQGSGNVNSFVQSNVIPVTSTQSSPIAGTSAIHTAQTQLSGAQQSHNQQHQQNQQQYQQHQQHQHHYQQEQQQQHNHQQQQHQQQYQQNQQHNQQQQHYQQQHHQQQSHQEQQHQQHYHQQQSHQEHYQQQHQQQQHYQQEHQQQESYQQQQQNHQHQHHYQQEHQQQHNHQQQQHQQQHHQQQGHQEQQQNQLHLSGTQHQQVSQGAANQNTFVQTPVSSQQNVLAGFPAINAASSVETNEISGSGSDNRCVTLRGQFPSNACHTFLNCWGGIATEQTCPNGLLFSMKGYCDYPENVNCAGRLLVASQPVIAAPVEIKSPPPPPPPTPSQVPSFAPTTNPTLAAVPTTVSTPTAAPLPTVIAPQLRSKCLNARGQFPSTSCNKFVNCWDDIILEQECPEGFLFSTKGYCDFSHNVQCGDRPVHSRDVSGADTSSKSECPLDNGTFRDRKKCSSYFTCTANKVVARYECPEGLNYNDYLGVCDFSYRVDCSKDPLLIPGRSNSHTAAQLRRGDECPADFATYRDANNCGVYYTCVSRTIVATYECPAGFNFNDEIGICDYAERVDCTKAPKIFQVPKNVLPQVTNDIKQKIDTCTPGTMFSLNPQCTAVCLCRNGMAEIVQCPAGLAYDSKMDKCILPHLAKC